MAKGPRDVTQVGLLGVGLGQQRLLDEPVGEVQRRRLRLQLLQRRRQRSAEDLVVGLALDRVLVGRAEVVGRLVQQRRQRAVARVGIELVHRRLAEQRRHLLEPGRGAVLVGVQVRHRHRAPALLGDGAPVGQR
ncbi:MAG: hypothetical protein ACK559_39385, partial [bacterium]